MMSVCTFCGNPVLPFDRFVSFKRFNSEFYDIFHTNPRNCWREYEGEIRKQTERLHRMEKLEREQKGGTSG